MGLGPPVCEECLLICNWVDQPHTKWMCPKCKKPGGSHLWMFDPQTQEDITIATQITKENRGNSDS